jgi:nucleotidyltransferase substrate binding protein (TIGR01987 family)
MPSYLQLTKFIEKGELSELEEQGIIKAFEYIYELAWNVIKDYYEEQGEVSIQGSRDSLPLAFQRGLIADADNWMTMIKSRIVSVHICVEYNFHFFITREVGDLKHSLLNTIHPSSLKWT